MKERLKAVKLSQPIEHTRFRYLNLEVKSLTIVLYSLDMTRSSHLASEKSLFQTKNTEQSMMYRYLRQPRGQKSKRTREIILINNNKCRGRNFARTLRSWDQPRVSEKNVGGGPAAGGWGKRVMRSCPSESRRIGGSSGFLGARVGEREGRRKSKYRRKIRCDISPSCCGLV